MRNMPFVCQFYCYFCTVGSRSVNTHPVGGCGANGDIHHSGWDKSPERGSQCLTNRIVCVK